MKIFRDTKGFIFDLDGTLIDSTNVWADIDEKFLGDRGFEVPEDYMQIISPMGAYRTAVYTIERFNLKNETPEDLVNEWLEMAKVEYHNHIKCKPFVKDFLQKAHNRGIKMAVATSSDRELFIPTLERENIIDYFDDIVTVGEVERGKEFPDVYLEAAKRINADVEESVVFEDILTAIKGAKTGGFKVVAVSDPKSENIQEQIKKTADLYINSYREILQVL